MQSKAGNKYIAKVKRYLKCSPKTKKKFLEVLIPEICSFELDNPNAQYKDYIDEFGVPKDAALEYLKDFGNKEKRAYWIPRIGAIIALVIIAFAFMVFLFIKQQEFTPGYFIESPAEVMPESEAEAIFNQN